jgi:hypothetical protein
LKQANREGTKKTQEMPMKVYFDRNVWGNLKAERGTAGSHHSMACLKTGVGERRFEIVFSTTVLEETMALLNCSPGVFIEEMRLIFELVEDNRIVKPADTLLLEAVQSYAHDRRLPGMYTRMPPILIRAVRSGKVATEFKQWATAMAELPNRFSQRMNPAFEKARDIGQERAIGRPDSFEEVWNPLAVKIAEWLCEHHGVHRQCMERGIGGLLENKAVRLYTIYYAAFVYSKWFGEQGKPGKVKPGEGGDFFHSVQAAAADVFVTEDARLVRWLTQVPVDGLQIMNLATFLDTFCS